MTYPAKEGVRSNRLLVDSQSASFYAGTEFRTFLELSLAAGASLVIQFTRTTDIIVRELMIMSNSGEIRCEVYRGGTPSADNTWTALGIFPKNEMSIRPTPAYTTGSTLRYGGTSTGGSLYDLVDVVTSGSSAQASTVGDIGADMIGAPAGTAFYKLSNPGNGTAKGRFKIWWEEIPVV